MPMASMAPVRWHRLERPLEGDLLGGHLKSCSTPQKRLSGAGTSSILIMASEV